MGERGMVDHNEKSGKYIYCIIQAKEPRQFTRLGIGERGDVVHTIHYNNLAAVVSDSPMQEYDSTRRNVMAHTLVLEEVMKEHTLLPVRFGTIAPDQDSLHDKLLKRRFGELNGLLQSMEGLTELGVKTFWYEGLPFDEILSENPSLRELRDRLSERPAEQTYYDRIALGEMIEKALAQKRMQCAERILSRLRPLARHTRMNDVITDRMVLNAAFLIEAGRQPDFDEVIQTLDEEMGDRLIFKYVGPVAPYNFVNIVVRWDE
jgi:hypothetical protein